MQDVVLDKSGKIDAVVVDVGSFLGMGGKNVAIPLRDIKTDNNRLTLDRTKEQLQQMAEYRLEDRNTGAGTSSSPAPGGRLGTGSSTTRYGAIAAPAGRYFPPGRLLRNIGGGSSLGSAVRAGVCLALIDIG